MVMQLWNDRLALDLSHQSEARFGEWWVALHRSKGVSFESFSE